jgi:hypothetical protein
LLRESHIFIHELLNFATKSGAKRSRLPEKVATACRILSAGMAESNESAGSIADHHTIGMPKLGAVTE